MGKPTVKWWEADTKWWNDDDDGHMPYAPSHTEYREMDGTGNNKHNDEYGSAGTEFIRLTWSDYEDGYGEPVPMRTNEYSDYRGVSNDIVQQDGQLYNSHGVSNFFTIFGQFLDHDIDLAGEGHEQGPYFTVPDYEGDPLAGTTLGITRSEHVDGEHQREHPNKITSYIDASNVYGSDDARLETLRDPDKPWLMRVHEDNPNLLPIEDGQFYAGDVRAGENSALSSIHTIWVLEHNRQAEAIKEYNPDWSYDKVFHAAKIKVEALIQHVVYDEWLPALVGKHNIPEYQGYDPYVDPTIAQEFAHGAFRFGHSLLSSDFARTDEKGSSTGDLKLKDMFFNPDILKDAGSIDSLVRGLATNKAQEIDHHLVEDLRSLLFGEGGPGLDLSVLNLLRGLDHGIGSLNDVRIDLGKDPYTSFKELTGGDKKLAKLLKKHYDSVDDVDLWLGGLIEEKYYGSQLGETFHHIVLDQFMRLRDGDAYYYEERLKDDPHLLHEIKSTTFSDIIKANTGIEYLQDDVFYAYNRYGGTENADWMQGSDEHDLMMGWGGNDEIDGGRGHDTIYGGDGDDGIWGGRGYDKLYGEDGHDEIHGGRKADTIYGGKGDDHIYGGRGADVINSGWGDDKMWGGKGRDLFVFEKNSGWDKIKDFDKKKDAIDLSEYGFKSYEEVKEASYKQGKHTIIELNTENGDYVKLVGVKMKHLSDDNFIYDESDSIVV